MYMCVLDSEVESQTEKLKFNLLVIESYKFESNTIKMVFYGCCY